MTRVVVVSKRTAYRRYVLEQEDPRAKQLLARRDPSVATWRRAHDEHRRTVEAVRECVEGLGVKATFVRGAHQRIDTTDAFLVVTVGGDGTLLAASHNVHGPPVLGVNSAPSSSVGFFCAARRSNLDALLPRAVDGSLRGVRLHRMQVAVEGRIVSRRVLNEALFCHESPAATARYILEVGRRREEQRSSGIWVGTAAGSTAALRSAGGRVLPLRSRKLELVVREPYLPPGKRYRLRTATLSPDDHVRVRSKMGQARVYLDGPDESYAVRLGELVEFGASPESLVVLGLARKRR